MGEEQEKGYDGILATRLRNILDKRKMTQKTLADQTGISRTSIGYYVNGNNVPDALSLAKIAKALDVSADYLLGLSENEKNEPKGISTYADVATFLDDISYAMDWDIEGYEHDDPETGRCTYSINIHTRTDKHLFSYYDALYSMRKALANVPSETTKQLLKPFQEDLKNKTLDDPFLPF